MTLLTLLTLLCIHLRSGVYPGLRHAAQAGRLSALIPSKTAAFKNPVHHHVHHRCGREFPIFHVSFFARFPSGDYNLEEEKREKGVCRIIRSLSLSLSLSLRIALIHVYMYDNPADNPNDPTTVGAIPKLLGTYLSIIVVICVFAMLGTVIDAWNPTYPLAQHHPDSPDHLTIHLHTHTHTPMYTYIPDGPRHFLSTPTIPSDWLYRYLYPSCVHPRATQVWLKHVR